MTSKRFAGRWLEVYFLLVVYNVRDFDAPCREKNIKVFARTVVDLDHQGSWHMKDTD